MSLTNPGRYEDRLQTGEACLRAYIETGSLPKAAEQLLREGVVTPRMGKKFDPTDVARLMRTTLLSDPEKYRDLVNTDSMKTRGRELTQEEWERFLVYHAMKLYRYSPKQFERFIDENNLWNYSKLWTDKYGESMIKTKKKHRGEDETAETELGW